MTLKIVSGGSGGSAIAINQVVPLLANDKLYQAEDGSTFLRSGTMLGEIAPEGYFPNQSPNDLIFTSGGEPVEIRDICWDGTNWWGIDLVGSVYKFTADGVGLSQSSNTSAATAIWTYIGDPNVYILAHINNTQARVFTFLRSNGLNSANTDYTTNSALVSGGLVASVTLTPGTLTTRRFFERDTGNIVSNNGTTVVGTVPLEYRPVLAAKMDASTGIIYVLSGNAEKSILKYNSSLVFQEVLANAVDTLADAVGIEIKNGSIYLANQLGETSILVTAINTDNGDSTISGIPSDYPLANQVPICYRGRKTLNTSINITGIAVSDNYVWFTETASAQIFRASLDISNLTSAFSLNTVGGLAVGAKIAGYGQTIIALGKLNAGATWVLRRISEAGVLLTSVNAPSNFMIDITVYNDKIYCLQVNGTITIHNVSTLAVEQTIVTSLMGVNGNTASSFTALADKFIFRSPSQYDGRNIQIIDPDTFIVIEEVPALAFKQVRAISYSSDYQNIYAANVNSAGLVEVYNIIPAIGVPVYSIDVESGQVDYVRIK